MEEQARACACVQDHTLEEGKRNVITEDTVLAACHTYRATTQRWPCYVIIHPCDFGVVAHALRNSLDASLALHIGPYTLRVRLDEKTPHGQCLVTHKSIPARATVRALRKYRDSGALRAHVRPGGVRTV